MSTPPRSDTPQLSDPIDEILWPTNGFLLIPIDKNHPHEILPILTASARVIVHHLNPYLPWEEVQAVQLDGHDRWMRFCFDARRPPNRSFLWLEFWEGAHLCGVIGGRPICVLDIAWDIAHDRENRIWECGLPRRLGEYCFELKAAGRKMLWAQYRLREQVARRHPCWRESSAVLQTCDWGITEGPPREWGWLVKGRLGKPLSDAREFLERRRMDMRKK